MSRRRQTSEWASAGPGFLSSLQTCAAGPGQPPPPSTPTLRATVERSEAVASTEMREWSAAEEKKWNSQSRLANGWRLSCRPPVKRPYSARRPAAKPLRTARSAAGRRPRRPLTECLAGGQLQPLVSRLVALGNRNELMRTSIPVVDLACALGNEEPKTGILKP